MRKVVSREETITREVETAVICDRCGRVATPKVKDIVEFQEFVSLYVSGGYGSVFGDGSQLVCDLCQHCVKELLGEYLRSQ